MTDTFSIKNTLKRMADLIRLGGSSDWEKALDRFASRIDADQDGTLSEILSTFGGMGSLNDIVLYANGQPLAKENAEFDILRRRLYDLCHA